MAFGSSGNPDYPSSKNYMEELINLCMFDECQNNIFIVINLKE